MKKLTIVGGGIAGLSAGYYAKRQNYPFTIYEAENFAGGNVITLGKNDFLFDSGAHRIHSRNKKVIEEVRGILGEDLQKVEAPSQIFYNQKKIDFPITPINLIKNIGYRSFFSAAFDFLKSRFYKKQNIKNFEDLAVFKYGRTIAEKFLLNYSKKLWGMDCSDLSIEISGSRIKGLNLRTFLIEAILGKKAKTEHLDGAFLYPVSGGIGVLSDKMAAICSKKNIQLNSTVTGIFHENNCIRSIIINNHHKESVQEMISSLPVNLLVEMLDPPPPEEILSIAKRLKFRGILLVALFLKNPSISINATEYYPEERFIFTRIYEPRNRNKIMAPPGHTSLVMEIPCYPQDQVWTMDKDLLKDRLVKTLEDEKLIRGSEVCGYQIYRMKYAYPVLQESLKPDLTKLFDYLKRFKNLKITGRNGLFKYIHIHDLLQRGEDIIEEITGDKG